MGWGRAVVRSCGSVLGSRDRRPERPLSRRPSSSPVGPGSGLRGMTRGRWAAPWRVQAFVGPPGLREVADPNDGDVPPAVAVGSMDERVGLDVDDDGSHRPAVGRGRGRRRRRPSRRVPLTTVTGCGATSTRSSKVAARTPFGPCLTTASPRPGSRRASAARCGSVSPTATSHSSRLPTATVTWPTPCPPARSPGWGRSRTSVGSRGRGWWGAAGPVPPRRRSSSRGRVPATAR